MILKDGHIKAIGLSQLKINLLQQDKIEVL
jgi:hypothetical protein